MAIDHNDIDDDDDDDSWNLLKTHCVPDTLDAPYLLSCLISTEKPLALLYNNNEKLKREIKQTIPFPITTKRIKYLGINLPKEAKDL